MCYILIRKTYHERHAVEKYGHGENHRNKESLTVEVLLP